MLIDKKVVAAPPGTDVVELGAMIQQESMRFGMNRAVEVHVIADGAIWIWNLIEEPPPNRSIFTMVVNTYGP